MTKHLIIHLILTLLHPKLFLQRHRRGQIRIFSQEPFRVSSRQKWWDSVLRKQDSTLPIFPILFPESSPKCQESFRCSKMWEPLLWGTTARWREERNPRFRLKALSAFRSVFRSAKRAKGTNETKSKLCKKKPYCNKIEQKCAFSFTRYFVKIKLF